MRLNKTQRQIREYDIMLKSNKFHTFEMKKLMRGKKIVDFDIFQIQKYSYLAKKIRNTDPNHKYKDTDRQIKLDLKEKAAKKQQADEEEKEDVDP